MNENRTELSVELEYELLMKFLNASVSKHLLDEHYTLVFANSRYYEMFGYEKEEYEALFHNRPDLFYANDPQDWKDLTDVVETAVKEGRKQYDCIVRMRHKDGRKLWIKLVSTITDDMYQGYYITYSVMMDVTDLMQTKIEQDATLNNLPGLIGKYLVQENQIKFIGGNQALKEYFDQGIYSLEELQQRDELKIFYTLYPSLRKGETCVFTLSLTTQDGKKAHLRVNAECIDWINDDPEYLMIYADITELTEQKKQLEEYNKTLHELAYTDDVTGGFNRRNFEQKAQATLLEQTLDAFDMVWLNISKFKLINEIGGVESGDRTLRYIHMRIRAHLGEHEYVARLFSDNFVILMKRQENVCERLEQIAKDINSFNEYEDYKYVMTFTAGIYHIDDLTQSITYMEDRAHAARKTISSDKSSVLCTCAYYCDEIGTMMRKEKEIENRMQKALDQGEFEVYLQPKFATKQECIAGAEALIRWNDPKRGLIPPSEFIPQFENNGFIIQLDLFVFDTVCELMRSWLDQGMNVIPISVNMSRAHLKSQDFLKEYISIKNRYLIPDDLIEIELTESMIMEDPNVYSQIIHRFHEAGFLCSMDDFGSGYSSLNLLKDIDVDVLKLDGAFFSNELMSHQKERIIIANIIHMAQELNIQIIAEGVETKEQAEFLRKVHCDFIQGYVYSKPLPIASFEKLYHDWMMQAL